MTGIGDWLQQLGLEKYAPVFAEHEITLEVLPDLTETDIDRLGLPTGPRRRLMVAIQALSTAAHSQRSGSAQHEPIQATEPRAAERRQLTVMFCDLVGSTALSQKLDPEELRDLMQTYQRACGEVVARYDGHVAQYLGDGLMVYFGWPRAHEDDAARAIRAGLEVAETVSKLTQSTPTNARVGIHTGLVVVGETGHGDASIPKAAVGETPNIAARLQSLAEPGTVVVSERTRALAGGLFDYVDLGTPALKGVSESMRLFRVGGPRAIDSRFEAARSDVVLTPLVGREEEISLLLRRWQEAEEGEGQVVLVGGEPGIGKSRLTRALRERLQQQRYTVLRYQCSPYHANSALYPIVEQFERAAGFAREDSLEQKLDKLRAVLAGSEVQVAESIALFAAMLSLPVDRYAPLNLSPQKQKERTLEALAGQVEALARRQPVLMIYEDVHWIDATSQEALDLLVPRLRGLPVLLFITYRPEYIPRWSEQAHVTLMSLNRLGRRQGAELVTKLIGGKALPQEVQEQILAHTDGVPLFVEELTKSILESKLLRDVGDRYVLDGPLPALAIPTTLRDSLIARLDRLAPIREVAQIGACIGREFSYALLAAISPLQGAQLDNGLEQLCATGLLFRRGTPPDALYTFKHALVQDAAYDSLLKSKRAQVHAQIAEVLESDFSDQIINEPEVLAYHFTLAGLNQRAVPYWLQAGQRALAKMALPEAVAHLTKVLSVNEQLPASEERDRAELDARLLLGTAYLAFLGWPAAQVPQALEPARDLAMRLGEDAKLVLVLYYIWFHHAMRCEYPQSLDALNKIDAIARSSGDSSVYVTVRGIEANTQHWMGNYTGSRHTIDLLLQAYDIEKHGQIVVTNNHDPKCGALSFGGHCLWGLGYPDQAREAALGQLELARRIGHPFNLCWALTGGAQALLMRGETNLVRQWAAEAHALGREHGLPPITDLMVPWFNGLALIVQGDHADGYIELSRALGIWRGAGGVHEVALSNMYLATALTALKRFDEARAVLDEALDLIDRTGNHKDDAEVYRALGELLCQQPTPDLPAAEASFLKALEVARSQETKGFELRAAMSLARLWQEQGKRHEARELLLPIYSWFTEGLDTKQLKDAKALLDELS